MSLALWWFARAPETNPGALERTAQVDKNCTPDELGETCLVAVPAKDKPHAVWNGGEKREEKNQKHRLFLPKEGKLHKRHEQQQAADKQSNVLGYKQRLRANGG